MAEAEGNVMTNEEFSDIEKKENDVKKKRFSFFKKKEVVSFVPKPQNVEGPLQEAILKLERLGGRVEILENSRPETNEKISSVIEKIGELRSSLIERDRSYNKLERNFDKISEVAKELELDDIFKNLEKKDVKIEKNTAVVESLNDKVSMISKKFASISSSVEQIKGLKDVVTIADELNKKINIVEELKTKTEKNAGKVDSLFYELKETYNKMRTYLSKIEVNEDSIKEMLRTVDRLSLKVEESSSKENMEKLKNDCEAKLSEFKFDTNSKIGELADIMKEVNRKIRGGTKTDIEVLEELIKGKVLDLPELKEDLPKIVKSNLIDKLAEYNRQLSDINSKIDKKTEETVKKKLSEVTETLAELDDYKKDLKDVKDKISFAEREYSNISNELTDLKSATSELKTLNSKTNAKLSELGGTLNTDLDSLRKKFEENIASLPELVKSNLDNKLSEYNSKLLEFDKKVNEFEGNSGGNFEDFKSKLDSIIEKQSEDNNQINKLKLANLGLTKKIDEDLTKKTDILVNLNKLKIDDLLIPLGNRVSALENMPGNALNSKFSELSDKIAALDNLEGMVDFKVIDNLNTISLELNTKVDNNISDLHDLKNSYKNQLEEITNKINNLYAYKDQKDKELTARVDLLKTEFKEYLDKKLERDTERKQKEVYEKVNLDKEYIEKKFLDFEVALVNLSKSMDDKIEDKLESSGSEPAEIKSDYRREKSHLSINKLNITKPAQEEEPITKDEKINRLINYIDTLISSGNYETAKEYYIKLLSEYERYEDGNPHILVKIAQFHDKLKN
ncbi:MAG: hypothetical protein DRP06_02310 [Candidatus Aenigmatarchaeota archaeon]|nr:MAG: hypothetical protein DRP06_02310 [Candidatus Aenigmarchaeota archaeon]